ncbi:MAG: NAD(P)/FAD-dependent oxidoreductase [Dehalococcoidales bacterium]|nr:NAD(P)/FAD-dependent oxidoreductase [Dehalococcoidales bacterium]
MYDVTIVGAGPAGSRVARRMAENGFSTAVLDKKQDLAAPVCCTGIVGQECIDRFAIDSSVIYRQVNSAFIYSPSEKQMHIRRAELQASVLDRAAFNSYLAGLAREQGAEYITDAAVTGFTRDDEKVTVAVRTGGGEKTFETRLLVIASGFGSKLTEMAGLGSIQDFAMGVQAVVDAEELEEIEVYSGRERAPGFFAWLVPTAHGKALAGLIARRNTAEFINRFLQMLTERGKIKVGKPELTYAGVALKPLKRTATDRILAVGSAAGQVKPVTGGGVYYGMLCADIAAENLSRALRAKDLTAGSLTNYDYQWRQLLAREINLSYRSRRFYELLGDGSIDRLFTILQKCEIDRLLQESTDLRFDWHGAVVMKLLSPRTIFRIAGRSVIPFRKNEGKSTEVSE